jgi:hypothetical protein
MKGKKVPISGKALFVFAILFWGIGSISPPSIAAQWKFEKEDISFFYDVLWLGNSDDDSAPSPLLGVVGGGIRFRLSDVLLFAPEIGFYGAEYFYREGKAYPAEIEYKDAVGVLGILIDPLLYYQYPVRNNLTLNGGFGPAFSFKIPLIPHGDAPSGEVGGYFLESARFLYLEARGSLEWKFTEALGLTVRLRTLLPVFHLWDGENVPFYDQLFFGGGIGLQINL